MILLADLVKEFEKAWPISHADSWDRVGLCVGSLDQQITKVLIAVDLTSGVIDEAIEIGANLIVTHHPLLFKPVDSVTEDKLKGFLLTRLIKQSVALYSAHTNADVQDDGASTLMAKAFGLEELRPLVVTSSGFGHGVIGSLAKAVSLAEFSRKVSEALPKVARKVAFSGDPSRQISKVAVCSGAGDSFLPDVLSSDADVYVTSDLRHHPALDAVSTPREAGPLALIDVSHWSSESLWVTGALTKLSTLSGIEFVASATNTDPWTQEVN